MSEKRETGELREPCASAPVYGCPVPPPWPGALRLTVPDDAERAFQFFGNGKPMVIIRPDGRVELGEGVALDEAARAFWGAVGRHAPVTDAAVLERALKAEARLVALGWVLRMLGAKTTGEGFGFGPAHRVIFCWYSGEAVGGGTSLWPSPELGDRDEARVTTLPALLERRGFVEEAGACRQALQAAESPPPPASPTLWTPSATPWRNACAASATTEQVVCRDSGRPETPKEPSE